MIKKQSQSIHEGFVELSQIQRGEKLLVKTNFEFIDCHMRGLLAGDVVVISGLSGAGKSETLFRLRDNIMDIKINPEAKSYVWLNYNQEVRSFNVLLRSLARKLNKKKQDILFNEFTGDDKKIVEEFYKESKDDRRFVSQDPITPHQFYVQTKEFLEQHRDKKAVHISFDHVALVDGPNKQKAIEELCNYVNQLKLEFDNAYFYLLSQLNRGILSRVAERDNASMANAGDVYASSSLDFLSSYNIVCIDANKMGIEELMNFYPQRYEYLEEYFTAEDKKGRVGLVTEGNLFYKIIKTRESDCAWKDLFVVEKDMTDDERERIANNKRSAVSKMAVHPSDTMPIFTKSDAEVMADARKNSTLENNLPF